MIQIILTVLGILLFLCSGTAILFVVAHLRTTHPAEKTKKKHSFKQARQESHPAGGFKAALRCDCTAPVIPRRYAINGFTECVSLERSFNGNLACEFGCLGLGSCVRACPRDAITLKEGRIRIGQECDACGLCVSICPKNLIQLVPALTTDYLSCAASGVADRSTVCPTAREGYRVTTKNSSNSGFKIWKEWAILIDKLRYM